jgi:hypothetical protein
MTYLIQVYYESYPSETLLKLGTRFKELCVYTPKLQVRDDKCIAKYVKPNYDLYSLIS